MYICGSVYTNKHFAAVTDSNFTDKPVEISKYSSLYIFINNIDCFVNDMTWTLINWIRFLNIFWYHSITMALCPI